MGFSRAELLLLIFSEWNDFICMLKCIALSFSDIAWNSEPASTSFQRSSFVSNSSGGISKASFYAESSKRCSPEDATWEWRGVRCATVPLIHLCTTQTLPAAKADADSRLSYGSISTVVCRNLCSPEWQKCSVLQPLPFPLLTPLPPPGHVPSPVSYIREAGIRGEEQ